MVKSILKHLLYVLKETLKKLPRSRQKTFRNFFKELSFQRKGKCQLQLVQLS